MGAVRVTLRRGGEDVFEDEQIGGDTESPWDVATTRFEFSYEVSGPRRLTIRIQQLHHDRRYSQFSRHIATVEIAQYPASDWRTVVRE